jgi:hypothetical protein
LNKTEAIEKGKNPIDIKVSRSNVKVTITKNRLKQNSLFHLLCETAYFGLYDLVVYLENSTSQKKNVDILLYTLIKVNPMKT